MLLNFAAHCYCIGALVHLRWFHGLRWVLRTENHGQVAKHMYGEEVLDTTLILRSQCHHSESVGLEVLDESMCAEIRSSSCRVRALTGSEDG